MSLRTPLAHVRGLGSAKDGTHHFWIQRLTAVALVPLTFLCALGFMSLGSGDYESARAFIAHPLIAVLMVVSVAVLFHHGQLGLQVVIEDYIHVEWMKLVALMAVKFAAVVFALIGILAVIRIAVGG